jgi:signal transduction histidine kinase
MTPRDLLVDYWLRAIKIGVAVTMLAVVPLAALPFIPHHGHIRLPLYIPTLAAAVGGAALVAVLPWRRLFQSSAGLRSLYAWGVVDIVLISLAIADTGGGHSQLFLLYGLTTVFFGASYPARAQVVLLAFTFASYLTVLAAVDPVFPAGILFFRSAALLTLAVLASFLSAERSRQIEGQSVALAGAQRWTSLVTAIARANREMPLDPERVVDVGLRAAREFELDAVIVSVLSDEGDTQVPSWGFGLPEAYFGRGVPANQGVVGLVVGTGRPAAPGAEEPSCRDEPLVAEMGFASVLASPIWAAGWLQAVLIGASREPRAFAPQEVEAFELLAGQIGMGLQNANRFAEEQRTVTRLQELDRMKSDFLATVSHELRTPLTVIKGTGLTLDRMWDDIDDPTRRDLVAALNANTGSLEQVITNLLDFSRLDAGQLAPEFDRVDLSDLLQGTARRLGPLFAERAIRVDVEPSLAAFVDPVLIDRAVENLLTNALKHTPAGTAVELFARTYPAGVMVGVSDTGPGVEAKDLERLGERFYRGGDLNTRSKGLGLGLALVREVLELHGSALKIQSGAGEGFRATFVLRPAGEEAGRQNPAAGTAS